MAFATTNHMKLNEYINITCGRQTGVFVGANAENEAFDFFTNKIDLMLQALYISNDAVLTIGYGNRYFSVDEYKKNKKAVFDAMVEFGRLNYESKDGYSFEMNVYVNGAYFSF